MNKLSRKDIEMLEMLAKTQGSKDALEEYIKQHNKAAKAYKIYRESVVVGAEVPKVEKPANELRAEIIEKAKLFLSEEKGTIFEFVIQDKRILVLNNEEKLFAESKCHPNDAFNEHIGKAIALGRALGKDVSEFENAPQPDVEVVGTVLRTTFDYENGFSASNSVIWNDTESQYGGIE